MAKTLLQKALETPARSINSNHVSEEQIELALAWMADEVTLTQVSLASGLKGGSGATYHRLAMCLREAYRAGLIKTK